MGTILPTEPFIAALQLLAGQHGTLLICDEVMTGFRVAYGGAQSVVNIRPDLTTLGKIVGGGLPLAAYGGRAEVMDQILPAGKVFQAGTLSGNPLATAAGIATLKLLSDGQVYRQLEALSTMLAGGLTAAAEAAGVSHRLARAGSMMTLFFNYETPIDWQTASASDMARYARYFWGMADRGIYLPCSQFEALFVSAAHTEADIHKTIEAAHDVLREI
jgi:glutamate-1-semialdehyde 2,1-aminomutase